MSDKDLQKEYVEAGVDLPELSETPEENQPKDENPEGEPQTESKEEKPDESGEEPKEESKKVLKKEEPAEEPDEHLQDDPKSRKRSIYSDYKDKKKELKSEKELREQAEKERDELKTKLDAYERAETPAQKDEAQDELEKFAKKINADPATLREMQKIFTKDLSSKGNDELKREIDEFKAWREEHKEAIEAQAFNKEFESTKPTIQKLFPKISSSEMEVVKKELDKISHTEEWHDKSLDYIAFKNQEKLSALVSPKKRGLESNTKKKDGSEEDIENPEFDPNADLSNMSAKEQEEWMNQYGKLGKNEGLDTDSQGRRIII